MRKFGVTENMFRMCMRAVVQWWVCVSTRGTEGERWGYREQRWKWWGCLLEWQEWIGSGTSSSAHSRCFGERSSEADWDDLDVLGGGTEIMLGEGCWGPGQRPRGRPKTRNQTIGLDGSGFTKGSSLKTKRKCFQINLNSRGLIIRKTNLPAHSMIVFTETHVRSNQGITLTHFTRLRTTKVTLGLPFLPTSCSLQVNILIGFKSHFRIGQVKNLDNYLP